MNDSLKKTYTCLSVLTPIFLPYSLFGYPVVLLAMGLWGILFLFFNKDKIFIDKILLIYCLFVILYLIISIFTHNTNDYLAAFNYIFCLLFVLFFVKKYFDGQIAYKLYQNISIIATFYIIVQQIAYSIAGIILSGTIPFLNTNYESLYEKINYGLVFRPSSFFSEPSGYGIYICIFLLLYLYANKKVYIKTIVFCFIGIIISKSSAGIISFIFILLLYFINKRQKISKKKLIMILILILSFFPIMLALSKTGYLNFIISHLVSENPGELAVGLSGRISSYSFVNVSSLYNLIFGNGFNIEVNYFMAGWAKCLYSFGFLGMLIYTIFLSIMFRKGNTVSKNVILYLIMISFFTNSFSGVQPFIYFPLIMQINFLYDNEMEASRYDKNSIY